VLEVKRGLRILCGLLVGVVASVSANAGVTDEYQRWTDENGTVHYSKEAPANTSTTSVTVKTAAIPEVESSASVEVVPSEASKEDETAARIKRMEQDLCDRAKESLRVLDEGQSIQQRSTATGEVRTLIGKEREAARLDAVAQVETFCGNSNEIKSGE